MAFSATKISESCFGNKRIQIISCTADANSGAVDTGLSYVEGTFIQPWSCTTSNMLTKPNYNSGLTASNGMVFCSGFTSGDGFTMLVIGY